jgi:hypothetical protein
MNIVRTIRITRLSGNLPALKLENGYNRTGSNNLTYHGSGILTNLGWIEVTFSGRVSNKKLECKVWRETEL